MNSTVLIRIRHRDIDPAVLTEVFGIEPEYCWQAGEAKPDSESGRTRRESYWVAEVPASHRFLVSATEGAGSEEQRMEQMPAYTSLSPLDRALMFASLLFRVHKEFWARLQSEGATAQLIVVLGSDSFAGLELTPEVMGMLARFGLTLSVSVRDAEEAAA